MGGVSRGHDGWQAQPVVVLAATLSKQRAATSVLALAENASLGLGSKKSAPGPGPAPLARRAAVSAPRQAAACAAWVPVRVEFRGQNGFSGNFRDECTLYYEYLTYQQ